MNPRKRKLRIRQALEKAAEEAAQTETKLDDEILETATINAKEKGLLTEAEAEEIISKLKPEVKTTPLKTTRKTTKKKTTTKSKPKTKEKKVGEEEQATTKGTKKAKESTTKRRAKRTTKRKA